MKASIRVVFVALMLFPGVLKSATFTVTNTLPSGAGSLQQAILDANGSLGADVITFNIPPSPLTIVLTNALPTIVEPVTIDGRTQPGFPGAPFIELNGINAGAGVDGLRIATSNCAIRALIINRFTGDGIEITNGANNVVEGCYIGLSATGAGGVGNAMNGILITNAANNLIGGLGATNRNFISGNNNVGIFINGNSATNNSILGNVIGLGVTNSIIGNGSDGIRANAPFTIIGGSAAGARNIISGNGNDGIEIALPGNNCVVKGNWIGTDLNGVLDRGNGTDGVFVTAGGVAIGGAAAGEGNVISGNSGSGVDLSSTAGINITVFGNAIGADLSGSSLGNSQFGVLINTGSHSNIVGGVGAGQGNHIAFNGLDGISVTAATTSTNNTFRGNSIHENADLGIDLGASGVTLNDPGDADVGANLQQNFPILTSATNTATTIRVAGQLNSRPSTTYIVDFYSSASYDSLTNAEGQTWLAATNLTTGADSNVLFNVTFNATPVGSFITATATDPSGNTSEFSPWVVSDTAVPGQIFTVINTNNSGPGSLRDAIHSANSAVTVGDRIEFNIPGAGVQTITPTTPLPALHNKVTIDGYTQPGTATNSSPTAFNGTVLIRIDGIIAGAGVDGFSLFAGDGHVLRGLMITRFAGDGIQINSGSRTNTIEGNIVGLDSAGADQGNSVDGINIVSSSGNTIGGTSPGSRNVISGNNNDGAEISGAIGTGNLVVGNLIGTDFNGTLARANAIVGVFINNAQGNTIGGSTSATRNLISGNGGGITLSAGTGTIVRGNYIGTDVTGNLDLGNSGDGINVAGSTNNVIGGAAAGQGNLISGNNSDGIEITGAGSSSNIIQGNLIGTTANGTGALANGNGINLNSNARFTQVGGTSPGQGNIIAFNGDDGIVVSGGTNNSLRANSIFANGNTLGDLGIDLGTSGVTGNDIGDADSGGNQLQNFPVLTVVSNSVSSTTISGNLNSATNQIFSIDFYSNVTPDASGSGQGQVYLGSTNTGTDGFGNAGFTAVLPVVNLVGRYISATATDTNGNTSEFATNFVAQSSVPGQTYTVINTNDSGAGSLRQAILDANVSITAGDIIAFNIPGAGVQTIRPTSALPAISDPVTINGYTQPGSVTNSPGTVFNGMLLIRLDGTAVIPSTDGLTFTVGGSTIRGLVIVNFSADGIEISGGSSNVIEGNIIGLDVDSTDRGNGLDGVHVVNSSFNIIGGASPSQRNVISGNNNQGIDLSGVATGNQIVGNLIGSDLTGTLNRGNSSGGVTVSGPIETTIGGGSAAARNVISGNGAFGISIIISGGNLVQGNYIGTTVSGVTLLGNTGDGVTLSSVTNSIISGNVVGGNSSDGIEISGVASTNILVIGNYIGTDTTGTVTNQNSFHGVNLSANARFNFIGTEAGPNVIAFNALDGVSVVATCTNNSIRANAIYNNGDLGIDLGTSGVTTNDPGDLDTGANQQQNFPVLTAVTNSLAGTAIHGTLNSRANATFTLDFFSNFTPDDSGCGQGQVWLGATNVITDASSNVVFAVALPVTNLTGRYISATATDLDGNTSEFSSNLLAVVTIPGNTYTVLNTNNSGPGSLRQAILDANASLTALDTIAFAIASPGSPKTIQLAGALPLIADPVTIDGYTQPGSITNSSANAFNGTLMIRLDGTNAGSGVDALKFNAAGNIVRGLVVINFVGATADALEFNGGGNNLVQGCLLGIDVNGAARGNGGDGVSLNGSPNNRIGGTSPGDRNVISGNGANGIEISSATSISNLIQGNIIGLDLSGTTNAGNTGQGIYLNGAPLNTVGGTTATARNVISANTNSGVLIALLSASNNVVVGNYIGTDITGLLDRGNGRDGVEVNGGGGNRIGNGTAAGRNILSGNGLPGSGDLQNGDGVLLNNGGARSNIVSGNLIGTDATGLVALKNEKHGIAVYNGAHMNTLQTNFIAGNLGHAIDVAFGSPSNMVIANVIGFGVNGTTVITNAGAGVLINFGSAANIVGGTDPALANVIANNATGVGVDNSSSGNRIIGNVVTGNPSRGIHVVSGTNNLLSRNLVFSNGGLGIDLGAIGVNLNDATDADIGPNQLQNFPVLTNAIDTGSGLEISGSLTSAPNTLFQIEFFASSVGDVSGYGEGELFLGVISALTDGSGRVNFAASLGLAPGRPNITATAADPLGNTSEFSSWIATSGAVTPLLTIQRTNSTQLLVAWPAATPPGFALESATNLVPVVFWSAITNSVSTNGAVKYVILNMNVGEPTRFYRLKQ